MKTTQARKALRVLLGCGLCISCHNAPSNLLLADDDTQMLIRPRTDVNVQADIREAEKFFKTNRTSQQPAGSNDGQPSESRASGVEVFPDNANVAPRLNNRSTSNANDSNTRSSSPRSSTPTRPSTSSSSGLEYSSVPCPPGFMPGDIIPDSYHSTPINPSSATSRLNPNSNTVLSREQTLAQQKADRQLELAKQAELDRRNEIDRQAEAVRQAERNRQAELDRQSRVRVQEPITRLSPPTIRPIEGWDNESPRTNNDRILLTSASSRQWKPSTAKLDPSDYEAMAQPSLSRNLSNSANRTLEQNPLDQTRQNTNSAIERQSPRSNGITNGAITIREPEPITDVYSKELSSDDELVNLSPTYNNSVIPAAFQGPGGFAAPPSGLAAPSTGLLNGTNAPVLPNNNPLPNYASPGPSTSIINPNQLNNQVLPNTQTQIIPGLSGGTLPSYSRQPAITSGEPFVTEGPCQFDAYDMVEPANYLASGNSCAPTGVIPYTQVPGTIVPPTIMPNQAPYGLYTPNSAGWRPLIGFGQDRYNVQLGRGIFGQPVAYAVGQPIRNFIRYIFP